MLNFIDSVRLEACTRRALYYPGLDKEVRTFGTILTAVLPEVLNIFIYDSLAMI
ncbi:hypothetical protein DSUL_20542 [Desulfovibrionales bacterium]